MGKVGDDPEVPGPHARPGPGSGARRGSPGPGRSPFPAAMIWVMMAQRAGLGQSAPAMAPQSEPRMLHPASTIPRVRAPAFALPSSSWRLRSRLRGMFGDQHRPRAGPLQRRRRRRPGGRLGQLVEHAVDLDGAPVISHYHRSQGAVGFATRPGPTTGLRWRHEQVDGYPDENGFDAGDRGKYTTLAVAADGRVWVAYQDVQNRNLRYATRPAGTTEWESGSADVGAGAAPDAGHYAAMALDAYGNPIVAHYDAGAGQLRVTRWNGTAFSGAVVDAGDPHRLRGHHRGEHREVPEHRGAGQHRVHRVLRRRAGRPQARLGRGRRLQHRDHRVRGRRRGVARCRDRRRHPAHRLP